MSSEVAKPPLGENTPIAFLDIRPGTYQLLVGANIFDLKALLNLSFKELCQIKNIGRITVNEIKDLIESMGYKLKEEKEQ